MIRGDLLAIASRYTDQPEALLIALSEAGAFRLDRFKACVECGRDDVKYKGRGLCKLCYNRMRWRDRRAGYVQEVMDAYHAGHNVMEDFDLTPVKWKGIQNDWTKLQRDE